MTHLVLVGMMGSGKTTVGRVVAERLGRPFLDSDELIEARTGRTVKQISDDEGVPAYRLLETQALLDALSASVPSVIAAAGGVVLSPTNRDALRAADATVVWLNADPSLLVDRVRSGGHRPLLDDDPAGTLQQMHRDREHLYREVADAVVDIDGRDVTQVADAVLGAMGASEK
ncbi:MAG TPA: shikimate kinase [Ilumatobacteraceae bacterium]|nr:shikimate kinase [Ilumatobacteraceae bacterium]